MYSIVGPAILWSNVLSNYGDYGFTFIHVIIKIYGKDNLCLLICNLIGGSSFVQCWTKFWVVLIGNLWISWLNHLRCKSMLLCIARCFWVLENNNLLFNCCFFFMWCEILLYFYQLKFLSFSKSPCFFSTSYCLVLSEDLFEELSDSSFGL